MKKDREPKGAARSNEALVDGLRELARDHERRYGPDRDLWALGEFITELVTVIWLVVSWVVRFGARHPLVALVVAVTGFVYWEAGQWAAGLLLGGLAAGMALWRRWDRESFTAAVTLHVRASWRSWRVYGRRWRSVMTLAGLTARFEDRELAPKLHHVAVRDGWDRLTVQMIEGQRPDDYTAVAERLAHAFGAISCRARRVVANTGQPQPGVMWLDFHYHDPLADVVAAIPLPAPDDGKGA